MIGNRHMSRKNSLCSFILITVFSLGLVALSNTAWAHMSADHHPPPSS
jgi:hypothetical protein